jgi:hypothetical protein
MRRVHIAIVAACPAPDLLRRVARIGNSCPEGCAASDK